MSVLTTVGVGLTAAVLSVGSLAGASTASAATDNAKPDTARQLAAACGRVDKQIARVEKVQARLQADASTPGSLARLQARVAKATSAGNAPLAQVLTDRLAIRKDLAARLPDVLSHLQDAQSVCTAHGASPAGSGTASS